MKGKKDDGTNKYGNRRMREKKNLGTGELKRTKEMRGRNDEAE